jgi:hypothetical protein
VHRSDVLKDRLRPRFVTTPYWNVFDSRLCHTRTGCPVIAGKEVWVPLFGGRLEGDGISRHHGAIRISYDAQHYGRKFDRRSGYQAGRI